VLKQQLDRKQTKTAQLNFKHFQLIRARRE